MTFLITFAYVRQLTEISQNIDDKFLTPKLKTAHDQLKFILGRNFYNDIVNNYNPLLPNDGFSQSYYNLYNPYIKEFLAWQMYEYYLIKANVIETRTGLRTFKEDNSVAASDKAIAELLSLARQNVQFYKGQLLNFISETQQIDSSQYTLFTNTNPANVMGAGFGITAINGRDKRFSRINTKTTINSGMTDSPPDLSVGNYAYNVTGEP